MLMTMFWRIDWLEPCDESYVEELDLVAAEDQIQKRKCEENDTAPLKKLKN